MQVIFDIQPKAFHTLMHNFAIAIAHQNNNRKQNHAFLLIVNFVTLNKKKTKSQLFINTNTK